MFGRKVFHPLLYDKKLINKGWNNLTGGEKMAKGKGKGCGC